MLDQFCQYISVERGLAPTTVIAYIFDVKEFLSFVGTERPLTALHVEAFVSHLWDKGLKSSSVNRKCMAVRCLYHYLVESNKMHLNVLKTIDPIRVQKETKDALDPQSVDALISALRGINLRRNVAIVLTLYHSGLRVSELCDLNLKDALLDQRSIKVNGKGSRERMVPMSFDTQKSIVTYLDEVRGHNPGPLFLSGSDSRITRRAISDMLTSTSRRAGIPHTTSHTLRRSCATSLMNRGVDLTLVQNLLGHQYLSATQAYLAISHERLKKVHSICHPGSGDLSVKP